MMKVKRPGEIRWVVSRTRGLRLTYLTGFIFTFASSILSFVDPLIIKWLIDNILAAGRVSLLLVAALALLLSYAGRIGIGNLGLYFGFCAAQRLIYRLKSELLRCLQHKTPAYHERSILGDILHRLDNDTEVAGSAVGDVITDVLRVAGMSFSALFMMFYFNWQLTLIVVPLLPVFLFLSRSYRSNLGAKSDVVQKLQGRSIGFLQEHLANIIQVQLLSKEKEELKRFESLIGGVLQAQVSRKRAELIFSFLVFSVVAVGVSAVLGYGGYLVIRGSLSTGGLVAFYGFTLQLFGPLFGFSDLFSRAQRLRASVRRILEIEETAENIAERFPLIKLGTSDDCHLEVKEVTFSYDPKRVVLNEFNLRISQGEKILIKGSNGSGKSTLAKLLVRLYDVDCGAVLVNECDVRDLELESLRHNIVYVAPEPMLRDATLSENVRDGAPYASVVEMVEAGKVARLGTLLERLPLGWKEPLGPHARISSGERQRVALARALLMKPKVLILDECLAAVDEDTEKMILGDLSRLYPSITIILISHDSYAADWADRVIMMESGEVIDEFTTQLLAVNAG